MNEYTIRFEVSQSYDAETVEKAIEQFRAEFPDAKITTIHC